MKVKLDRGERSFQRLPKEEQEALAAYISEEVHKQVMEEKDVICEKVLRIVLVTAYATFKIAEKRGNKFIEAFKTMLQMHSNWLIKGQDVADGNIDMMLNQIYKHGVNTKIE